MEVEKFMWLVQERTLIHHPSHQKCKDRGKCGIAISHTNASYTSKQDTGKARIYTMKPVNIAYDWL